MQTDNPDSSTGIDLGIGLGIAQRQTGNPAYRGTLLEAARQAAESDDTDRLVVALLANDRGLFSAVGAIDSDKVEMLETGLARACPLVMLIERSCLHTFAPSLHSGARSNAAAH